METLHQSMKICGMLFCLWISLSLRVNGAASKASTFNVYLNSYAQCGHEITYEVSLEKEYLVKPDVSPKTKTNSFRNCEVTFHSPHDDGHICLIQDNKEAQILDMNAELIAYDGYDTTSAEVLFHLEPYPRKLTERDICSKTPYITLLLQEIRNENSADIRKVHLSFRIVDISSPSRQLYMFDSYCNGRYSMLNSQIMLTNRPHSSGTPEKISHCRMWFEKVEPNTNTSICVVYIPHPNRKIITCDSQWEFVIYPNKDLNKKNVIYSLRCNESTRVNEMHAWCGSADISLVTVVLHRYAPFMSSNLSVESPGEFRFLMADHEGSADSLLEMVKESLDTSDSNLGTLEIVLICVCVTLLVILCIIVIVNRKKLPCFHYAPVSERDPAGEIDAL